MNRYGLLVACCILFFYSGNTLSASSQAKVAIGEWPPYASASLPHKGLLPLIVKKALAYSDTQVEFDFMSWEEAYEKTLSGEYDISPGWVKTDARNEQMMFSQAMSYIDLRFFHNSNRKFSWENIEEIYPLKLGVVSGYSYAKQLDLAIQKKLINTRQYDSDRAALFGLAKKEIDLYPADALVATHYLNKLHRSIREQINLDEHTISNSPIFLIGKKNATEDIIEKFNYGLIKLRENGEYAKILENFHLVNKLAKLNFYTEDNAPLNYQDQNGPAGIMVTAINTLLSKLGADLKQINIQVLPWARAYQNLENNNNAVLFAVTKTEQRADQFKWVGPVYRSNIILLALKDNYQDKAALKILLEKHVCAVKNDVGAQLWKTTATNIEKLHLVSHPSQCAKMLSLGRVDLWATGKDTARWHIQKNQLDLDIFKEVYQLKEAFRFIAFSKDVDNDIIDSLQKTLSYLQLSGQLNELIQVELEIADKFAKRK